MEKVLNLIENINTDEMDIQSLYRELSNIFNTFSKHSDIIKKIRSSLSETGLKNFDIIAFICMLDLAYHYEEASLKCHDLRIEASEIFAYNNKAFITEKLTTLLGFKPEYEAGQYHLARALNRYPFRESNQEWILEYLNKWMNEHSTIKQNFIRGYTIGYLEENYMDKLKNNSDYGISFPMV